MEKVLTADMPSADELCAQFDEFVTDQKNFSTIKRHGRISIAPNGSFVPEVPKIQREHILAFSRAHNLRLESELIATLIDPEKVRILYDRSYRIRHRDLNDSKRHKLVGSVVEEIHSALNSELSGKHVLLSTGLEVANAEDLKKLHKYTHNLDDFVAFAEYMRARHIMVGANVLIGAPMIKNAVEKTFATIRFAFENMHADKILLIAWNPVKHTVAKQQYDKGMVDVVSATEAAEIYRIARMMYPKKIIEYNPLRSHIWHGKHANFREQRIVSAIQKENARTQIKRIASRVFRQQI